MLLVHVLHYLLHHYSSTHCTLSMMREKKDTAYDGHDNVNSDIDDDDDDDGNDDDSYDDGDGDP